jgi:hypothetical protein
MPFLQKKIKVYNLRDRLTFGKHQGETLQQIIDADPEYVEWMIENIPDFDLDAVTMDYFEDILNDRDEINFGDIIGIRAIRAILTTISS